MDETGYKSGNTAGGRWGCAISIIVGLPLISLALIVASMGSCVPGEQCTSGGTLLLIACGITLVVGVGARAGINAVVRWRSKQR